MISFFTSAHKTALKKIPVIPPKHGLKLRALLSFESGEEKRIAGDEWQLEGPLTYYPQPEVVSHFVFLVALYFFSLYFFHALMHTITMLEIKSWYFTAGSRE